MSEENKAASNPEQDSAKTEPKEKGAENPGAKEKKYTDDDVNNLIKKNKEKAVNDFLSEYGITDREAAKKALASAQQGSGGTSENTAENKQPDFEGMLLKERADKERVLIENIFLTRSADPKKIEKAARLIDLEACKDDNGNFDRKKAESAVDDLLKEWPEIVLKKEEDKAGFVIGANSQPGTEGKTGGTVTKRTAQKSWNRFN